MSPFDSLPLRSVHPHSDHWTTIIHKPIPYFPLILLTTLMLSNQPMILVSAGSAEHRRTIRTGGAAGLNHMEKPSYCQRHSKEQPPNTFLWRIKRQPAAYFFGTIHVPYTEVWDYVSTHAKDAFRSADTVFLELVLTNPLTLRQLAMCQLLPGDEHLRDHIPTDMYERLQRLMERMKKALPSVLDETDVAWSHSPAYIDYMFDEITGNWNRKRPVWVMTMLDSLSLDTFRHRGEPTLDLYLAQEASMLSKPLGAIESVQEQCEPLNSLDKKHALIALNRTLARQEALADTRFFSTPTDKDGSTRRTVVRDLIENYNCGSLNESIFARSSTLAEDSKVDVDDEADFDIDWYFRQELIDKRNERMAERVLRLLESDREKSFFFAFGAAHFIGARSVVELVKQAGYDVEPVPINGWYDEDTVVSRRNKHRQSSTVNHNKQQRRQRERKPNSRRPFGQRGSHSTDDSSPPTWMTGMAPDDQSLFPPAFSTPRQRIFQELWVRMDGYTPRPYSPLRPVSPEDTKQTQERLSSFLVADTPKSYVLVQYHYHAANGSNRPTIISEIVIMFPLIITSVFQLSAWH